MEEATLHTCPQTTGFDTHIQPTTENNRVEELRHSLTERRHFYAKKFADASGA